MADELIIFSRVQRLLLRAMDVVANLRFAMPRWLSYW
jgi:hypothetical protein